MLGILHQLMGVTSLSSLFAVGASSVCLGDGVGSLGVQFGVPSYISGCLSGFFSFEVHLPSSAPVAHLAPTIAFVLPPISSFVC